MKFLNLFKKDNRSKKEIYEDAINSFPFDYHVVGDSARDIPEVPVSMAIKCIPELNINLQECDYYA